MARDLDTNVYLDSDFTQQTGGGGGPSAPASPAPVLPPDVSAVGQNLLTAPSEASARNFISAAKSGANSDINTFSALTGVGGFGAWTGTPNKTSQATYSGTASVAYTQAELQGVMDAVKHVTELAMALVQAHLDSGVLEL